MNNEKVRIIVYICLIILTIFIAWLLYPGTVPLSCDWDGPCPETPNYFIITCVVIIIILVFLLIRTIIKMNKKK